MASRVPGPSDGVYLYNDDSHIILQLNFGMNKQVKGHYTAAKLDGDHSFYVVYDNYNFQENSRSWVVEGTKKVDVGVPIRSLQGHDDRGITLFPHCNFCGQGVRYMDADCSISGTFSAGQKVGVSSLIVQTGKWRLYAEEHYRGPILGDYKPGDRIIDLGKAKNKVKSIKLLYLDNY